MTRAQLVELLNRTRGVAEASVFTMHGQRVVTFAVDGTLEMIDAALVELGASTSGPAPQVINDTCAHCVHPSESHHAGHGKCFKCDPLNRCARFVAHEPAPNPFAPDQKGSSRS